MFTGLVQESARVLSLEASAAAARLSVETRLEGAARWALGASIAVNGVCLTVVANEGAAQGRRVDFDLSPETLARTNLGELKSGSRVHLEPALSLGDPLGGHLVSGHVDGLGRLARVEKVQEYQMLEFEIEGESRSLVGPYLVSKGSVAVDGVSLTVNTVRDEDTKTLFQVMLIPHTLELTRFGVLKPGDTVNLEADLLAKYVCRNLEFRSLKNA